MYSIGEFSKITHVTPKALRHYDDLGLLTPTRVDPVTGYRFYESSQLQRMHRLLALKQMGLELSQIRALLDSPDFAGEIEPVLARQRERLLREQGEVRQKLRLLETFLRSGKDGFMKQYTATIKTLPAVTVASMRRVLEGYDELFHLMPEVLGPEMERLGCKCADPDYCFCIYHDGEYREHNIDAELCQAVTQAKQDSALVQFRRLPEVPSAVCVLHKGPYSRLGEAYGFTMQWIERNGYTVCGEPRESYIDGIWNRESEEEWLTELQFPVCKA